MRHYDRDGPIFQYHVTYPGESQPPRCDHLRVEDLLGDAIEFCLADDPRAAEDDARQRWRL